MKALASLRIAACLLVLLPAAAGAAQSAETEAGRRALAERYLKIMPMADMMNDIAIESAAQVPPEVRQLYIDVMTKSVNIDVLEESAINSLASNFTARELELFIEFYSRPEMKVAMKKFGKYMADVMPVIQQEVMRAMTEAVAAGAFGAPPAASSEAPSAAPK